MNRWAILTVVVLILSLGLYLLDSVKKKKDRRMFFSLFTVFAMMWLVIIGLGACNFYGLYEVSEKIYFLLFLGIVFWIFGFFSSRFMNKTIRLKRQTAGDAYAINTRVLCAYIVIVTLFNIIIFLALRSYVRRGNSYASFHNVAFGYSEETMFQNAWMNQLYARIMFPIVLALLPTIVVLFCRREHMALVLIASAQVLIYCVMISRRIQLMYLALDFVLAIPLYRITISKKTRKRILYGVIILFVIITIVSAYRKKVFETGRWSDVFKNYVVYLNLCINIGDHWIREIDAQYAKLWMYGYNFMHGVLNNLDFVFRQLGIKVFSNEYWEEIISLPQDIFVSIGDGYRNNAYTTWVFNFYLDFRYLGVIVGSYFFGLMTGRVEKTVYRYRNVLNIVFYLLFCQAVFKSFVRWEFSINSYVLAFLYARLLVKRKPRRLLNLDY